jgi:hypothetical protein
MIFGPLEGLGRCWLWALRSHLSCMPRSPLRWHDDQHITKAVVWPNKYAEHATYFSSFTRLRHFGWNFVTAPTPATRTDSDRFVAGPSTGNGLDNIEEQVGRLDDTHLMAELFAAH